MTQLTAATSALDALRGRAKARTLDSNDLLQALDEARTDVWGNRAGATVANCYNYPAQRMALAAVRRTDGQYAVWMGWNSSAKKGTSPLPAGLPRQQGKDNATFGQILRSYADNNPAQYLLSAHEVSAALRERRAAAREQAKAALTWTTPDWDGIVTRADSIAAGNCERTTDEIGRGMHRKTQVQAARLRTWIESHRPELGNYADRAIEHARQATV